MVVGFCVKCKAKHEMVDVKEVVMANGRRADKGKCSKCGTGMFKIKGNAKNGRGEGCGCPAGVAGGARRSRRSRRSSRRSRASRK